MEKRRQIRILSIVLILFITGTRELFSQNDRETKLKINDSVRYVTNDLIEIEKLSFSVGDSKIINVIYWPNKSIRGILLRKNDSAYISLSFNYVGKVISQSTYKVHNDSLIADGIDYHFGDNGILSHIYTYSNGEINGVFRSYYENGVLKSTGEYVNGAEKGVWIYYSKKGIVVKKVIY